MLTLELFIHAEESMNSEAKLNVQRKVKGHHVLGNSYLLSTWSCCLIFQDVAHSEFYSCGIILPSAIKMGDV